MYNWNIKIDNDVVHFGIKFDMSKTRSFLTRNNYAKIDKYNYEKGKSYKYYLENWSYFENMKEELIKDVDQNYNLTIYPPSLKFEMNGNQLQLTDDFCEKYHKACMINYDLNMNFIKNLDKEKFVSVIDKIIKDYNMIKITDLNTCKGKKGIYMMVLDNYKQVYIGQTTRDIRERILRHWKNKPCFDKVLFGRETSSVISIDSYGFLDTSRIYTIFLDDWKKIDEYEENMINNIPNEFLVNRIGGGIHLNTDSDFLKGLKTINKRNL